MELLLLRCVISFHSGHSCGRGRSLIERPGNHVWPLSLLRHCGPEALPQLFDRSEVVLVRLGRDWYEIEDRPRPYLRVLHRVPDPTARRRFGVCSYAGPASPEPAALAPRPAQASVAVTP
jgi:hypothetical protein